MEESKRSGGGGEGEDKDEGDGAETSMHLPDDDGAARVRQGFD